MVISSACLSCINYHGGETVTQRLKQTSDAVFGGSADRRQYQCGRRRRRYRRRFGFVSSMSCNATFVMHTTRCGYNEVARHCRGWAIPHSSRCKMGYMYKYLHRYMAYIVRSKYIVGDGTSLLQVRDQGQEN